MKTVKTPKCVCGNQMVPTIVKGLFVCQRHKGEPPLKPLRSDWDPYIRYPAHMSPEEFPKYRKQHHES